MVETDEDRLALLDDFGEDLSTEAVEPLRAIFDREVIESIVGEHAINNRQPQMLCRTSDVESHGLVKRSVVARENGERYAVKDFDPDGTGFTVVTLSK